MEQSIFNYRSYRRDCWLGALGALLMLAGDLCLSVIPAHVGDSGLFAREAYLSGGFSSWRLPLLVATGLCGMSFGFFSVRASYTQVLPQYRKTRTALLAGGVVYVATAGALHLFIGSLADWTGTLAPVLGRETTLSMIQSQYARVIPAMGIAYAGMILMILASAYAVLARKTVLPRRMFLVHMIVWQILFVLIPDVRQMLGAEISTWDFVLSQGSGNAALLLWMAANAIWAGRQMEKTEVI